MNGEVDAQAHQDRGEGDGQNVEMPDGQRRVAERPRHADGQHHQPDQRMPHAAKTEEHQHGDAGEGNEGRPLHVLLRPAHFVVFQDRNAGQRNAGIGVFPRDLPDDLPQRVNGRGGPFEAVLADDGRRHHEAQRPFVIEDVDHFVFLVREPRIERNDVGPRIRKRILVIQKRGEAARQPVEMLQNRGRLFRMLRIGRFLLQLIPQPRQEILQAHPFPVAVENRLVFLEPLQPDRQLLGRQVLQPLLAQLARLDAVQHVREQLRLLFQPRADFILDLLDLLRSLRFDDDHQVVLFAEALRELDPALLKRGRRVDQVGPVGFEPQMAGGVPDAGDRRHDHQQDGPARTPDADPRQRSQRVRQKRMMFLLVPRSRLRLPAAFRWRKLAWTGQVAPWSDKTWRHVSNVPEITTIFPTNSQSTHVTKRVPRPTSSVYSENHTLTEKTTASGHSGFLVI